MTRPASPVVSVLMPTYQHRDFVRQAIDSVLAQKCPFAFELLVSDDASPDGTGGVVTALAAEHPTAIHAFVQPRNLGAKANIQFLFGQARGRYIALLEGDDYWAHPEKLARQVAVLESDSRASAVAHIAEVVDVQGRHQREIPAAGECPASVDFAAAARANNLHISSVVFRREWLPAPPAWALDLYMLDWPMLVDLAHRGPIRVLAETWSAYRVHGAGIWSGAAHVRRLQAILEFYERVDAQYDLAADAAFGAQRKSIYFELFRAAHGARDQAEARRWLWRYWTSGPGRWRLPPYQWRAISRALTGWPCAQADATPFDPTIVRLPR